jgi:hypothetical protein
MIGMIMKASSEKDMKESLTWKMKKEEKIFFPSEKTDEEFRS